MKIFNFLKQKNADLNFLKSNKYIQNAKEIVDQVRQKEKIIKFIYKDHVLYTNNDSAALYHIANSISKIEKLAFSSKSSVEGISLDIGANVGLFSYFYRIHNPNTFIYLFEPDPFLCEIIYKNLGKSSGYKLINKAVGDKSGISNIYINTSSRQTSSLDKDAVTPFSSPGSIYKTQIQCITLDDFCAEEKISSIKTLKIDIQGLEFKALSLGVNTLKITDEIIAEICFLMPDTIDLIKLLDSHFPFWNSLCDTFMGSDVIFLKNNLNFNSEPVAGFRR